ncbi:MAG: ferritin-like domain-containing protein [Myxococcota bacterium]|mgnify:CR=1 FL=1
MTSEEFVSALDVSVRAALARIGEASASGEPGPGVGIADLLVLALRNEIEASEEAALWLVAESDVEVKLALARQCGDEAKHYRLIAERLRALGRDPSTIDPLAGGPSPMFEYLRGLGTTVERIAAGPFTREALASVRNEVFIEYCEAKGDAETARLYRDTIQPDETHHHALGRGLLLRLADTPEKQDLAGRASARTLEVAAELQEIARLRRGICRAPGC